MKEAVKAAAQEMTGAAVSAPEAPQNTHEVIFQGSEEQTPGKRAGNLWFDMDTDGIATINITKAEMGQHVGTALAQTLAEELEVPWQDVRIRHVDSHAKWGPMITGGSWSINTSFDTLRRAGAAGRLALVNAGAGLLGEDPDQCFAQQGQVMHRGSNKSIRYADIIKQAAVPMEMSDEELAKLPVKTPAEYNLIGKNIRALDIPAKTDGSAIYGIDVFRPNMFHGHLVTPPVRFGAKVTSIDDSEARTIPGFVKAVALTDPTESVSGFVACIADTFDAAARAAQKLHVEWDNGAYQQTDDAQLDKVAEELGNNPKHWGDWVLDGDADQAFDKAAQQFSAAYTTRINLHAPMEPANAIVEYKDDMWHAWTGNQNHIAAVPLMAKALGVDEAEIVIHPHFLGGGFGKRLDSEFIVVAALASKAMDGRPVKIIYTREQDLGFDTPRSPSLQLMQGGLDAEGHLDVVIQRIVAGWPTARILPAFMAQVKSGTSPIDSFAASGADFWYSVRNHKVRAIQHDLVQEALPPGYLRTVGPGFTVFAVESFIEEMADLAGKDSVAFRLDLLDAQGKQAGEAPMSVGGASRQAHVLKEVVARTGYGSKQMPANSAMGLACSFGQERNMPTWIACVAEVSADPATGEYSVSKLTLVADAGIIINPDSSMTQMQSALLWGFSLATQDFASMSGGSIDQKNFNKFRALRMKDIPEMDIQLVESEQFPVGIGEPAASVVAPAIANALARAIGARVRDLPITPEKVKQALKK